MSPPIASHFSNALFVQRLLLHGAVGRPRLTRDGRKHLALAAHIARLSVPCARDFPRTSFLCNHADVWGAVVSRRVVSDAINRPLANRRVPMRYDDGALHLRALVELLGPLGLRVAQVGELRAGAPAAKSATFLITGDDEHVGHYNKDDEERDDVEPLLFVRAVRGLLAGRHVLRVRRESHCVSGVRCKRYRCTVRCPGEAAEGEEQQLTLAWAPSRCFHVRRLFLTGPDAFVTDLMLRANEKGYALRPDGLFARGHSKRRHSGTDRRAEEELVELRSEKDIFTTIQVPYVDPLHRHAYCLLFGLY